MLNAKKQTKKEKDTGTYTTMLLRKEEKQDEGNRNRQEALRVQRVGISKLYPVAKMQIHNRNVIALKTRRTNTKEHLENSQATMHKKCCTYQKDKKVYKRN
jgi:hypothetical protein